MAKRLNQPHWDTCARCGASVLWATTRRGRSFPLDAIPDPDGAWWLYDDTARPVLGTGLGLTRYTSHFATCKHPRLGRHG